MKKVSIFISALFISAMFASCSKCVTCTDCTGDAAAVWEGEELCEKDAEDKEEYDAAVSLAESDAQFIGGNCNCK